MILFNNISGELHKPIYTYNTDTYIYYLCYKILLFTLKKTAAAVKYSMPAVFQRYRVLFLLLTVKPKQFFLCIFFSAALHLGSPSILATTCHSLRAPPNNKVD